MPDEASAAAPGRVNLIGEHTDYHEGFVLPAVIERHTRVHLRRRLDNSVAVTSTAYDSAFEYGLGSERVGRGWIDYVQGVTASLAHWGAVLSGFDLRIDSTIPPGAGLSSSAALTVALLRGLRALFDLPLDDLAVAMVARAAETEFVGAPVGVMDPMVCSLGRQGEALFIDTRTLEAAPLSIPPAFAFGVLDSGITHEHAGGGYAERRRESFEAAAALGVTHLRDLSEDDLPRLSGLAPLLARRARHVITENRRVLDAVGALRDNDVTRLGRLLTASHASLRNDYDVSTPTVDTLVSIAQRHPGVYGARMTGGGFGGAVVIAFAPERRPAMQEIAEEYRQVTGLEGTLLAIVSSR